MSLFFVQSTCGTTYGTAPSIDGARAIRAGLPHTEAISAKIYLQLGEGLYNYETLDPKYLAQLTDRTEKAVELDQINTRLEQDQHARRGAFAVMERVAKVWGINV